MTNKYLKEIIVTKESWRNAKVFWICTDCGSGFISSTCDHRQDIGEIDHPNALELEQEIAQALKNL